MIGLTELVATAEREFTCDPGLQRHRHRHPVSGEGGHDPKHRPKLAVERAVACPRRSRTR